MHTNSRSSKMKAANVTYSELGRVTKLLRVRRHEALDGLEDIRLRLQRVHLKAKERRTGGQ